MKYGLTSTPTLDTSDCLIIGLFNDGILPDVTKAIDEKHHGLVTRLASKLHESGDTVWQADIDGKSRSTTLSTT